MPQILEIAGLTVRLGERTVIGPLDLTVEEGATLAILGPSGAGKTVLFRALIGALPYHGTVRWADGTKLGYVPQKLDLERDLPVTGQDLLRARAAVAGRPAPEINRVRELVRLPEAVVAQPIGTLSGGQFQRLLLAFALVGKPTVLLCDEPTAGVDEPGEEQLYEMLDRLRRDEKLTLLFISHELNLISRHATAVLCLSPGRPAVHGPPPVMLTAERLEEVYGGPLKYHQHDDHLG